MDQRNKLFERNWDKNKSDKPDLEKDKDRDIALEPEI